MPRPTNNQEQDRFAGGLNQLQRYLGDEAAPMMVADAIQPLLQQPPDYSGLSLARHFVYHYLPWWVSTYFGLRALLLLPLRLQALSNQSEHA